MAVILEPRPPRWWQRWPGRAWLKRADERARRRRGLLLIVLAASLAVSLLSLAPAFRLAEARVFDYFSTAFAPPLPAAGPIVVAIDEPSFAELGLQWPWPRDLHAQLVHCIRAAGARAIGLDIIFAEPSALPGADAALAASVGPDTVLAGDVTFIRTPQADQTIRTDPLPELIENGARSGLASVTLDGDGTLRLVPRFPDSFAAELLRAAGEPVPEIPPGALLQTFGPHRTYPTVSYYQALDPDNFLPPGIFRDRVVLVGVSTQSAPSAESGTDAFPTSQAPRSGRLTAGVEVQATIYDNLRTGAWILPLPTSWGSIAAALAAALLAGAAVWRGTGWKTLAWGVGAVLLLALGSFLLLRFGRVWAPPLAPVLAFLLVAGGQGARDYASERKLRRGITRAFSQYLSPVLVQRLADDPTLLKLGGETRTLSILFSDVRGFTKIAERMKGDPQGLTRLMNRLLNPLSQVVIDGGGTIDKYIGDAVMAFWNAPLDDPDHALHAVETALAMNRAIAGLNAELAAEAAETGAEPLILRIGVGVNTGGCVVGNMGSDLRFDYSALGDAVNLAARLEGETKRFDVPLLIGENTAKQLEGRLPLLPLDRILVKGKTEPVAVFTVLPTADAEAVALHRAVVDDFFAGSLRAGDPRLILLEARLPGLRLYYADLRERLALVHGSSSTGHDCPVIRIR